MHQPYYKDPDSGTYALPWVRLHAIKDYVALPRIFREYPKVRHTFNLVPSLLVQVRDYVENGAEDHFLTISRKNALDLSRDEQEFLLRNFFSAYAPTMILPQPRYAELYRGQDGALRGLGRNGGSGSFGASEYTDLVALFNLAWFHPLHLEEDPYLSRLWRKGGRFTETEKSYILDRQIQVMGEMFEEYSKVERQDGGELSSSPMYHPILPLLIDNKSARDAFPGVSLPDRPFAYPRDARRQLDQGREVFRELFGAYPRGLWPSEGSISPATLDLAAKSGFRWAGTDEILLSKAFGKPVSRDSAGVPNEPEWLYRPYSASTPSGEVKLLFRDHHLSDLIGFDYPRWDAVDAANNFVGIIRGIYSRLESSTSHSTDSNFIVPVILDGENAWEYYPDSGVHFLRSLLSRLENLGPEIECVPISEAIDRTPGAPVLQHLPTGSWIDGTFHIWIGHHEDHAAWDMLSRARALWETRAHPLESAGKELPDDLRKAEEYLLVAEGSDWCWWYGDDHYTPHGPEFDRLFRHNIKAAYLAIGVKPPDILDIPIVKEGRLPDGKNLIPAPRSYIRPSIDGLISSYLEWSAATSYIPNPEFGSMHRTGRLILDRFQYGFSEDVLYFRLDLDPVAIESASRVDLELVFPAKNRKIRGEIELPGHESHWAFAELGDARKPASGAMTSAQEPWTVAFNKVVEIGIPMDLLQCRNEDRLEFFITIQPAGTLGERWPLYGTFSAELPGLDFEERMWQV